MVLIKIGDVEVNPDQIKFIAKTEDGFNIVFVGDVIYVPYDSDAHLDLSMFITHSRYYYGKPMASEESEIPESSPPNQTTNEGV